MTEGTQAVRGGLSWVVPFQRKPRSGLVTERSVWHIAKKYRKKRPGKIAHIWACQKSHPRRENLGGGKLRGEQTVRKDSPHFHTELGGALSESVSQYREDPEDQGGGK